MCDLSHGTVYGEYRMWCAEYRVLHAKDRVLYIEYTMFPPENRMLYRCVYSCGRLKDAFSEQVRCSTSCGNCLILLN